MALSDGATSAKYAQEAARITVNSIIQYFEEHTLRDFLCNNIEDQKKLILECILKNLLSLAKEVDCLDSREFSATLLFFVSDGNDYIICHLGDGAIFLANESNDIIFYSEPENANNVSNRTFFCVSLDAIDHLRITHFNYTEVPMTQVLMTSDGVYLMFYNRGNLNPSATAKELLSYVDSDTISTDRDLQIVLSQMAEVASERLDDWSMIIYTQTKNRTESNLIQVSMLSEELEKSNNKMR